MNPQPHQVLTFDWRTTGIRTHLDFLIDGVPLRNLLDFTNAEAQLILDVPGLCIDRKRSVNTFRENRVTLLYVHPEAEPYHREAFENLLPNASTAPFLFYACDPKCHCSMVLGTVEVRGDTVTWSHFRHASDAIPGEPLLAGGPFHFELTAYRRALTDARAMLAARMSELDDPDIPTSLT